MTGLYFGEIIHGFAPASARGCLTWIIHDFGGEKRKGALKD
jgi:hypothetical protein